MSAISTQATKSRGSLRILGWVVALIPLGFLLYFVTLIDEISKSEVIQATYEWVPSLSINFSFYVDGLSLLMALLVSGIGGLVAVYAGGYLAGAKRLELFYGYLLMFMVSMLGVVTAGNLITLFVFWEMTSLTSYLLIGYKHDYEKSRKAALKALLVTGSGGLALLAGFIMLGIAGGSYEISTLLAQGEVVQDHKLYVPLLVLILLGAFTKSAQMPFHFWLPAAMEAPAPVSAYLHSATMVKAGVFLLARLAPVLGGTTEWQYLVTAVGGITMLLGGYISLKQTDLKRILAYSTISALGTLVFLLGIGTPLATKGAMVFLVVHSFYKGALFLTSGAIDHETGTRDIEQLGGLRQKMPITFAATALAAMSMAGLPPLFGFISKEVMYETTLQENLALILTGGAVLANMFAVAVASIVILKPFLGSVPDLPKHPHEAPLSMWLGPVVLASLGLAAGLFAYDVGKTFIEPASTAILQKDKAVKLALWHGINMPLLLSGLTLAGGAAVYLSVDSVRKLAVRLDVSERWGPAQGYETLLTSLLSIAAWQTRILQNGRLRTYIKVIILAATGLVGFTLLSRVEAEDWLRWPDAYFYEYVIAGVILMGTLMAVRTRSRLAAVAALGVVGYGIALIFLLFGAPDLAMTQFAIETLVVILFVLVLYRLPLIASYSTPTARMRDAIVALVSGGLVTVLILIVSAQPHPMRLTPYFADNSYLLAKGRNVVNVILVDFRGIDTMGEIVVIATAALGVVALLKLRLDDRERTEE